MSEEQTSDSRAERETLEYTEPEYLKVGVGESLEFLEKAGNPRPDLNGQRLKLPGNAGIFLIDRGYRRLIPDLETFFGLFRDNDVVLDPHLDEIPIGTTITHGACLAKANDGSAAIYLVDNGVKRGIASLQIFGKYHFNENRIVLMPPIIINSIPNGDGIAS